MKPTALATLSLLFVVGCGAKEGSVVGSVAYNGKTLTHGTVTVHGANGIPVNATIDDAGNYEVKGVALGNARVTVIQLPKDYKSPAEIRKEYQATGKKIDPALLMAPKSMIPTRYGNAEETDLRVTVTSGKTPFNIALIDKN